MKSQHLTDDEIQDFLDGNIVIANTEAYTHLESCIQCRSLLESYQNLYKELGKEPAFRLSQSFADDVVKKIRSVKKESVLSPTTEIILILGGLLAALGATLFFVDLKPILEGIGNIGLPQFGLKSSLLNPIKNLFSGIDGGITVAPFAVLTLILVAAFDRLIQKRRHHKIT